MAILIPSKNIYEMDNPKIRDNVINKIEIGETIIKNENKYDTTVYTEKIIDFNGALEKKEITKLNWNTPVAGSGADIGISTVIILPYYQEKEVLIKVVQENSYVQALKLGVDNSGVANIKYSPRGYVRKMKAIGEYYITYNANNGQYSAELNNYYTEGSVTDENFDSLPLEISTDWNDRLTENIVEPLIQNNFKDIKDKPPIKVVDGVEYFPITIKYLTRLQVYKIGLYQSNVIPPATVVSRYDEINAEKSEFLEYVFTEIGITVNGDTIGINLTDGSVSYGSGNNPSSLDGNELMQDSSTSYGKRTTEFIANSVLNGYAKGKETATLLCDINEYYEYDKEQPNNKGELKISTKSLNKMFFEINDSVLPMIRNAKGKDEPMSKYKDGTPKEFRVVAVKPFFDGAVWQELTLQEK